MLPPSNHASSLVRSPALPAEGPGRLWQCAEEPDLLDSVNRATSPTPDRTDAETWTRLEPDALQHLNPQDRKLIRHWCTSTYRTISCDESAERVWGVVVPQVALGHSCLLHSLLAVSALQLASTSSGSDRKKYLEIAQSHRAAIVPTGGNLDSSSDSAAFARSTIMTAFFFGLPRITRPDIPVLENLLQIFQLVRFSMDLPEDILDRVQTGQLGSLIYGEGPILSMPDTSQLAIHFLWRLNATLGGGDARHEKDIYEATIQHLSFSFETFMNGGDATVVVFLWICRIPSGFISAVKERQPFALVILAHFAVILHSLRRRWWMGDWSARLLHEIVQALDGEWRRSVSWVLDAVGWYMPETCNSTWRLN